MLSTEKFQENTTPQENATPIATIATDFGPEARYNQSALSAEELSHPQALIGQIVHVKPNEFLAAEHKLKVKGKNFGGIIETDELSIYPLSYFEEDTKLPKFLCQIFKSSSCLTAEIVAIDGDAFILSRKSSMKRALDQLNIGSEILAFKTASTKTCLYLDIGAGINAILPVNEITISRIDAAKRFARHDFIPVLLTSQSSEYANKFVVSYRKRFPLKEISEGDIVQGEIIGFSPDRTGLFVELSPNQSGLTDTDLFIGIYDDDSEIKTLLGKTLSFRVKRVREPIAGSSTKRYQLVPIF